MSTLGARLRAARVAAGYETAASFALAVHLRPERISKYEHDQITPGIDLLVRFARAANVSIDWLATGEGAGPEGLALTGTDD